MSTGDDDIREVISFFEEHKPKRAAAVARGLCGSCCDVGRWNVRATVISVPPIDHVQRYGAKKERVCAHCAEQRESHGWGYTTLRVL